MSDAQHLVQMANDIGNFFRPQPREEAIEGIANHIKNYWTRRMREAISAHLDDSGLDDLPQQALRRLLAQPNGSAKEPPGGDAG